MQFKVNKYYDMFICTYTPLSSLTWAKHACNQYSVNCINIIPLPFLKMPNPLLPQPWSYINPNLYLINTWGSVFRHAYCCWYNHVIRDTKSTGIKYHISNTSLKRYCLFIFVYNGLHKNIFTLYFVYFLFSRIEISSKYDILKKIRLISSFDI